jgi:hypothetical protein
MDLGTMVQLEPVLRTAAVDENFIALAFRRRKPN